MNEKTTHLTTMELFQGLSEQDQEELDRMMTMTTVRKGKIFYRPEDRGEIIFILKKGAVQLYRISPEGKKLVIYTLSDGSMFGEMSLLGQRMHNTFAEAITDCTICVMSRNDLERLILTRPQIALRILEITGNRLRETEEQLEALAFKSIPSRLAALLLRLAREGNEVVGLTHQDLAEMIGTYRETTTQSLNDMKAQGILEIGRRRITILDRDKLAEIANR
ncbi:MAG TPA: Crp/Fnr family transcriptional regulator [Anaerolineae bacterium]|nr:Crp/Fnr family transcriptional regulator [Caldilineae bacterium]HID35566.1 Crp/Fnr family transcriptional regulator [Anaerolineae bacterium]HIQ11736.1 Crp/Fnr family transcriptional regulator [Caldilineales bacterium]